MTVAAHIAAQLRSAEQVLAHFDGSEPFPVYLKAFFRMNSKFGSRDRRQVSAFCYACQRLGHALADQPLRERILAGYLLCVDDSAPVMEAVRPEWLEQCGRPLDQRLAFLSETYSDWSIDEVFPLPEAISADVDKAAFIRSHFQQPGLFIRIRPGQTARVKHQLDKAGIAYRPAGAHGLAMDNATKLETLGVPDQDYVVQDLSSQVTASFFPDRSTLPPNPLVWDACAGSGGKTIMAMDILTRAQLYVSDIRPSILQNLRQRFRHARIQPQQMAVIDLTQTPDAGQREFFPGKGFDLVIADVPCSGSGTWGRDPWMLAAFHPASLERYAQRQKAIVDRLVPNIASQGYLLYITCSVYAAENEAVADHIESKGKLQRIRQQIIPGYTQRADSMFAALFRRP